MDEMGGRPPIPADHLISPLEGTVGFRYLHLGYQLAPPPEWEDACERAEEQTDDWEPGGDWQPVVDLYTNHRGVSPLNGWLVDA